VKKAGAPRADERKVTRALELHQKGATVPEAARRAGVSESTVKRAKRAAAAPGAPAQRTPGAEGGGDELGPDAPAAELLAEVDAALQDLPADPEARVIGAALRLVVRRTVGLEAGRIPQVANGVRTLVLALREMRPPPPPSPDLLEEQLRQLDAETKKRIEQYLPAADAALEQRMAALRAWGARVLNPALAVELGEQLDALFAPP
jgi:Homeodomain-like domain